MIQNASAYVIRVLESYVTECRELRSVPPEVLRDELQGVVERIEEMIGEIGSHAQQPHEAASEEHVRAGTEHIATGVSEGRNRIGSTGAAAN